MQVSSQNKKGRPTLGTQSQIKSTLLQYYEAHLFEQYAARKTGLNVKTVYKYYRKFREEDAKSETSDYLERQKQDRIQIITSFDSQIDEVRIFLSQINSEIENSIKEKKPIPRDLLGLKLNIMRFRLLLVEKKASFTIHSAMAEAAENKTEENMEKHDHSREHH